MSDGELCRLDPASLQAGAADAQLTFHEGRIGGAWPTFPGTGAAT